MVGGAQRPSSLFFSILYGHLFAKWQTTSIKYRSPSQHLLYPSVNLSKDQSLSHYPFAQTLAFCRSPPLMRFPFLTLSLFLLPFLKGKPLTSPIQLSKPSDILHPQDKTPRKQK